MCQCPNSNSNGIMVRLEKADSGQIGPLAPFSPIAIFYDFRRSYFYNVDLGKETNDIKIGKLHCNSTSFFNQFFAIAVLVMQKNYFL